MIIVDYGLGNIFSLTNWFKRAGIDVKVSNDLEELSASEVLILPGVGAYRDAMEALRSKGMDQVIKNHVNEGKPIVGICLGMQLFYEGSYEGGYIEGLSLLEGELKPFSQNVKVPHMGWNNLRGDFTDYVYFIHSYYADSMKNVVAYSEYDVKVPAVVRKNNVLGFQFHPEKSGPFGEKLLDYVKEFINENISSN
jgi:glutamine amidotransferase